jgi:hypothetical protein
MRTGSAACAAFHKQMGESRNARTRRAFMMTR